MPTTAPDAGDERTRWWRSLRARVLVVVAVVVLSPLALGFVWGIAERQAEASLREAVSGAVEQASRASTDIPFHELKRKLEGVATQREVRISMVTGDDVTIDVDRRKTRDPIHDLSLLVLGDDRSPTFASFDEAIGPISHRPEVRETRRTGEPVAGCRVSVGSKLVSCHLAKGMNARSDTVLYVQQTDRRALRVLYDSRYQILRLVFILSPLLTALAWWMSSRFVRPIQALRTAAREKAMSARPQGPLPELGDSEVGDLSRSFNLLLVELDERRRDNERFVADAAHELKNPVAAIRAAADTLESGNLDDARVERLARVLRTSSAKLDTLIQGLLELARAEAGMPGEDRSEVDLVALALGLVESAKLRFPNVAFSVSAASDALVSGVAGRLESLLQNLIDNAASFAQASVVVSVEPGERCWLVRVRDDGPGIDPKNLPRVFDRFFTSRPDGEGTGLGLALAKAIAQAHGGDLAAASEPGHGATFEASIPRNA